MGLSPLPGTHYYPAQPVLQMPRQLDCFQGDDTRLGFWQGRTNSHDGKTYNIIEREIERHRSPPSKRFFIGSCHLLTIPGSALPTIFCRSPAGLSYPEILALILNMLNSVSSTRWLQPIPRGRLRQVNPLSVLQLPSRTWPPFSQEPL